MKLAVDLVIRRGDEFLLIRRKHPPFQGGLALPGGFVEANETVEAAAVRELEEETGVEILAGQLHMIGVYSKPDRDPRWRVVSVAYFCELTGPAPLQAGDDAADAMWVAGGRLHLPELAFDHARILLDVAKRWGVSGIAS